MAERENGSAPLAALARVGDRCTLLVVEALSAGRSVGVLGAQGLPFSWVPSSVPAPDVPPSTASSRYQSCVRLQRRANHRDLIAAILAERVLVQVFHPDPG